jgi:23S rRNA (cytidine1920-2'-O)/16S rRNA (cytidine1409-2'-O)-methyltransferase
MTGGGEILSLIKPQFVAGAKFLRKGVVTDPAVHTRVCDDIRAFGTGELPLEWLGLSTSPLKGPKGNVEFLAHWRIVQ